jgi:hypothetical protein
MRLLVPICAVVITLYWADHSLYAGYYAREAGMLLRQIFGSYH